MADTPATFPGPPWATRVELLLQKLVNQGETASFERKKLYLVLVNLFATLGAQGTIEQEQLTALQQLVGPEDLQLNALLQQVIALLTPAPPPPPGPAVSFQITVVEEENSMAKAAATHKLKVSILGNGTAVATISGIADASGLPTTFEAGSTAVWVREATVGAGQDPGIVLTPSVDAYCLPTGCGIAPSVPPVLVSGDTLTCTVTQPTTGAMTPQTYNPVNVVAGPANTFVISVQ